MNPLNEGSDVMDWVEGVREAPVLEACMKLIAWGPELKRRVGAGHEHFIITNTGEYYRTRTELNAVEEAVHALPDDLTYIREMETLNQRMMSMLSGNPVDVHRIVSMLIEQISAFYIARIKADQIFEIPGTGDDMKQDIIAWRNSSQLFDAYESFLKLLSLREHRPEGLIDSLTLDEMSLLLEHEPVDWVAVERRLKGVWSVQLVNGGVVFSKTNEAPDMRSGADSSHRTVAGTSVVKGLGVVRGVVGKDILVVEMTRPEMIGIMKQSSAVITNEGGVLSHAAVICRELKIPCVIGTKHATKILKQGDMVEVDTETGTVNVL